MLRQHRELQHSHTLEEDFKALENVRAARISKEISEAKFEEQMQMYRQFWREVEQEQAEEAFESVRFNYRYVRAGVYLVQLQSGGALSSVVKKAFEFQAFVTSMMLLEILQMLHELQASKLPQYRTPKVGGLGMNK